VFRTEVVARDKRILVRTDVVIIVGPIVNAAPPIEARLRRQRRPTDVIFAGAPRDPGGRPLVSRHPDPTDPPQPNPAAIVISRPTERLVGNPGPTGVAVSPAALCVRTPVARRFRFPGLPDVAVIAGLAPFAVGIELLVKHSVGLCGTFLGLRIAALSHVLRGRGFLLRDRSVDGLCICGLTLGNCLLARIQSRTLVSYTLFFRVRAFGGETILDLPLDLGLPFFFGLLFLARNKNGQCGEERDEAKLLHGVIRQGWLRLIRSEPDYSWGAGATVGVGETGTIVTFSILSRRAFWIFA
jgi:hypothetical protein